MDARAVITDHELLEMECLARYAQTKHRGRFMNVTVFPDGFADVSVEVGNEDSEIRFAHVTIRKDGTAEAFAC